MSNVSAAHVGNLEKAPFVNSVSLKQHLGQKVFIAGKVIGHGEGALVLQTSDNQRVQIFGSRCQAGEGVAVLCLVFIAANGNLTEVQSFLAGNNFESTTLDLGLYEELSKLCNGRFAELF
eukprot:jgi/Galph1/2600/GphlegSOOS_G1267.1